MRRVVFVWLFLSLAATGVFGYLYMQRPSLVSHTPATRAMEPSGYGYRGHRRGEDAGPSIMQGENLALTVSIASSIISALAAIAQTWLTHRAIRSGRGGF